MTKDILPDEKRTCCETAMDGYRCDCQRKTKESFCPDGWAAGATAGDAAGAAKAQLRNKLLELINELCEMRDEK